MTLARAIPLSKPPQTITAFAAARSAGGAALLFGGRALAQPEYLSMWKNLPADSNVEEVIRNFFIRQPLLWDEHGRR